MRDVGQLCVLGAQRPAVLGLHQQRGEQGRSGQIRSDLICPVPSPPLRSAPSDPAQLRPLPPAAARPRRPLLLLAILQQLPGELPLPLQAQADPFLVLPQFIPLLLQLLRRDGVGLRAGPALGGGSPHRCGPGPALTSTALSCSVTRLRRFRPNRFPIAPPPLLPRPRAAPAAPPRPATAAA